MDSSSIHLVTRFLWEPSLYEGLPLVDKADMQTSSVPSQGIYDLEADHYKLTSLCMYVDRMMSQSDP